MQLFLAAGPTYLYLGRLCVGELVGEGSLCVSVYLPRYLPSLGRVGMYVVDMVGNMPL